MNYRVFETVIGGRKVTVETGKYCEQASGSCLVRCGETAVMVNVTMAAAPREGMDYFPLGVDFEEKMYSVGKIPGGFKRREGRPSDKAILVSRLIDRPLRPLFPKGLYNDVNVVATAMSVEPDIPPEIYAMIGSSVALTISDIPWAGPTGAVVVGLVDGEYVINPDSEQRKKSRLHLSLAGTKDAVMMVEAGAQEISEEEMIGAILFGHEEIKKICQFIEGIRAEIGKPKREMELYHVPEEIDKAVREYADEMLTKALDTFDRQQRQANEDEVNENVQAHFAEIFPDKKKEINDALYYMTKEKVRARILNKGIRPDGRKTTEVRPIWCEHGILPRVHGSAVFTRGQTQVLNVTTLGTVSDAQKLEGLDDETSKRYMHHYNFPPFCTGETGRMGSPKRREIGHGNLAERALLPVLPDENEFPYAIRVVSEVMESNGSSSMASTCGSTLALMDGGVPIKRPVSGIAMGLIQEEGKTVVLSDIQGLEDFLGDMDFKVTGTTEGITALQMDNKATGLTFDILARALQQAKEGRAFILQKMLDVIPEPRHTTRSTAPRIVSIQVPTDKIRDVIGSGGKVIRGIQDETGASVDIQEDGTVFVGGTGESVDQAVERIKLIIKVPEPGEEYTGRVVSIQPFGAFVNLLPGKDGLLHISRVAKGRVEKVEDVLNVGDEVKVVVIEVDDRGKISLDRLDKPEAPARAEGASEGDGEHFQRRERPRRERSERSDRPRRPGDNGGRKPRRHHDAE